jgi:uncharacterized protein YndB with AHSA1/START domain
MKTQPSSTKNSRLIHATPEKIYQAFASADAIATWQAPGDMTAIVHQFDFRVGGGYEMSLYYPPSHSDSRGKTSAKEDRFTARFVELTPPKKIVQAIKFQSPDTAFASEMIMMVTLEKADNGTRVTFLFENLPAGVRPEDNETGTELTLKKLARYVE